MFNVSRTLIAVIASLVFSMAEANQSEPKIQVDLEITLAKCQTERTSTAVGKSETVECANSPQDPNFEKRSWTKRFTLGAGETSFPEEVHSAYNITVSAEAYFTAGNENGKKSALLGINFSCTSEVRLEDESHEDSGAAYQEATIVEQLRPFYGICGDIVGKDLNQYIAFIRVKPVQVIQSNR